MRLILRSFIKLSVTALILLCFSRNAVAQETVNRPNIIYILADDAGYGDFGVYGQADIQTPQIDKMAKEGIVFTSHYAGSTVCAPSRNSLLTGKHTGHTQIRGNAGVFPEGQRALKENTVTLGSMMKKAGMATAVIGKWGLGAPGSSGEPNKQGFDHWFGYLCQRQAHNYYPSHLWRNGKKVELDGQTYAHDLFTEETLKYIRQNRDRRFFLFLPYTIPHAKLQVPDLGPYKNKDWPENKKKLAAMITRMDSDVGKILALLRELALDKKTMVMFSSDNGPHAEGGASPDFFNSSGPFRGKKRDLYEGGIRVPLVAWWPGTIEAGRRSDHVSAFWDMMPTFAELAGVEPPSDTDGFSIVPTLLGKPGQKKHDYLYWEFHEKGGAQAVRQGKWKAVKLNVRKSPSSIPELYNLERDPGESLNLAAEHPEILQRMSATMVNARTKSDYFPLIGKQAYRLNIYNGWIFSSVFLLTALVIFLIGRPSVKMEYVKELTDDSLPRNLLRISVALYGLFLYCFSAFLPLWAETAWFDASIIVCVIGLAGYSIANLHYHFRRPNTLMTKGLYRLSRNPAEVFHLIFWCGLGFATFSSLFLGMVAVNVVLRHLVIRLEEKSCKRRFHNEYLSYREKTARYLLF